MIENEDASRQHVSPSSNDGDRKCSCPSDPRGTCIHALIDSWSAELDAQCDSNDVHRRTLDIEWRASGG